MLVNFAIVLFPVLCGFSIASLVLSRQVLERREVQSAADAMALAAAHSLEQLGLDGNSQLYNEQVSRILAPRNARLAVDATFNVKLTAERRPQEPEHRAFVRVDVAVTFDSRQSWPGYWRMLPIHATAYAQVNENVFGDKWPAMVMAIDASKSMSFPILGSATTPAFTIVQQAVIAYVSNTLPVRNGVVIFNDAVVRHEPPPAGNVNNLAAIQSAFTQAGAPTGLTNARAALDQVRVDLTANTQLDDGRNVVFISDGEPTLGGACPAQAACHFTAGVQAATQLRDLADSGAALFTLEIRRSNYWTAVTDFMHQISGGPHTAGNDPTMSFSAQNQIGITSFITGLTRSICAFGPLTPRPLTAGTDAFRLRPPVRNPGQDPRRVFAFLREQNGQETPIPFVPNRDLVPTAPGFEYATNVDNESFVILTLASCNQLGADATRRLVVRWDEPQLIPPPKAPQQP